MPNEDIAAKLGQVTDRLKVLQQQGTAPTSGAGAVSNDAFSEQLQQRLLAQSDVISSQDTQLEETFASAISGTREAQQASAQRIESQFGRERAFQEGQASLQIQGQLESRTGFGTQMVALRNLVETTDKELKDLDQRKQELILQGESAAASQIAGLQVQALQFKQQARQQTFTNLLNLGQLGVQQRQLTQQQQQFNKRMEFDEQTATSAIALKYGLSLQPGETLEDLSQRAVRDMGPDSPAALEIRQAKSTIDRNNAEISRIQAQVNKENKIVSPQDKEIIARAMAANPALAGSLLGGIESVEDQAELLEMAGKFNFTSTAENAKASQIPKDEYISSIRQDTTMSSSDKATAIKAAEEVYGDTPVTTTPGRPASLPGIVAGGARGFSELSLDIAEFLTGVQRAGGQ